MISLSVEVGFLSGFSIVGFVENYDLIKIGWIGFPGKKAPRLNGKSAFRFVVIPSGQIKSWGQPLFSWYLSIIAFAVVCLKFKNIW